MVLLVTRKEVHILGGVSTPPHPTQWVPHGQATIMSPRYSQQAKQARVSSPHYPTPTHLSTHTITGGATMASLNQHATRIGCVCLMIVLVLHWLPFPLCVLLLAAYLGRVDSSQSLEDDVARLSKVIRDRVTALGAMLATSTAVRTMKEGEDDDADVKAADATGDAAVAFLPDCLWDLQQAQRLLEGRIQRQVARVLMYEEETKVLSQERVSKLKAHAIDVQAMQSEHHAQVKALNHEITTLRKDAAKERAAWEAAVEAAKEGGGGNEDERVQALNDEITMLRKNAARERAALEAAVQAAKEGANDNELVKQLTEAAAKAQSRVQALNDEITVLHENAAKALEVWDLKAATQTAKEAMYEEELAKLKQKAVNDSRSLSGDHKLQVRFLQETIAKVRDEAVQERAAWEEGAAVKAAEEQELMEEMKKMRQAYRRVEEEAIFRGRECVRWRRQAEAALAEVQGLQEERDVALAEVPRVMEKMRTKAEKERKQVAADAGVGKEGGKETQEQVPTTGAAAATSTTKKKGGSIFPYFTSLPPLVFSYEASPGTAAAAAGTTETPATTKTAPSFLAPTGSSSLFSGSSLFGPSSPSSAFAPIAPPPAAGAAAPAPPALPALPTPPALSLMSNITPSFTSSWGNLSTTPATEKPGTIAKSPTDTTTTTPLPIAPYPPIASKAPSRFGIGISKPATKQEEAMPAPVPLKTTAATDATTSLPIAPQPPIASKAPAPFEKPATKEEEAAPVPLKKEIGTSTEPVAPSEEKEKEGTSTEPVPPSEEKGKEGEQAAVAPKKEGEEAAKATPPMRPRMRRGFKITTF